MGEWLGDARDFLKGIIHKQVRTYDPSKNSITVAGMKLDGVVTATLSEQQRTQGHVGVDPQYYAVTETVVGRTFNIELLPTCMCYKQLKKLDKMSHLHKAFFRVNIVENGDIIDEFMAHFLSLSSVNLTQDTSNKQVTFGVVPKRNTTIVNVEFEKDTTQESPLDITGGNPPPMGVN